jgi:hypothetical protein
MKCTRKSILSEPYKSSFILNLMKLNLAKIGPLPLETVFEEVVIYE